MVTAFVVTFCVALTFVCGLVLDGGRLLVATREARSAADAAARAGAQAVSEDSLRDGGGVVLDPGAAEVAACDLLAREGYACGGGTGVAVVGGRVTVTVEHQVELMLLPVVSPPVTAEGTACLAWGITGDEPTAAC